MKKFAALSLTTLLSLSLVACGGSDEEAPAAEETTTTTTQEAGVTDAEVEAWAKSMIGYGEDYSWSDIGSEEYGPSWAYAVNRVYYGHGGNLVFEMQLDRDLDKPTAEKVAKLYANALRLEDASWARTASYVIVENGVGEHITQERVTR